MLHTRASVKYCAANQTKSNELIRYVLVRYFEACSMLSMARTHTITSATIESIESLLYAPKRKSINFDEKTDFLHFDAVCL